MEHFEGRDGVRAVCRCALVGDGSSPEQSRLDRVSLISLRWYRGRARVVDRRQHAAPGKCLGVLIRVSPAMILSGFAAPIVHMPQAVAWQDGLDPVRNMLTLDRI